MKKLLPILLFFAACTAKPTPDTSAEVKLYTTEGDIVLRLDGRTPKHRDNFLRLTREGFFDSLLFHRVIEGFVIQAGDPDSRHAAAGEALGRGGAGNYTIEAEIAYPALRHTRGALSAARQGDEINPQRRSSSSQFYIVWGDRVSNEQLDAVAQQIYRATSGKISMPDSVRKIYREVGGVPHLDVLYTVFGNVVEGLEVVERIQRVETDSRDRPIEDVRILRAEILREPEQQQ